MEYLDNFHRSLQAKRKGSLVRVSEIAKTEPNAKKYLNQLAADGRIKKIIWGWYWVPDNYKDFYDFLARDRNLKVLHKQSAASFWNGDFVHREQFAIAVNNRSLAKALGAFAKQQGWKVSVETRRLNAKQYKKVGRLYVETLEETIIDCIKSWAFADAFSSLRQNRTSVDWKRFQAHYWERIPKSTARVGQILQYGARASGNEGAALRITDDFLRRQVEEAVERVSEFA